MRTFALKEGINRILDDGGKKTITKRTVMIYGSYDVQKINLHLQEWQQRGLLKIVKPLEEAKDNEVVIEMLDYIDQKSAWPNWPPEKS